MKTKLFFSLILFVGVLLISAMSFRQEGKNVSIQMSISKLDPQRLAIEHNNLLKEFWGKFLKGKNLNYPFNRELLYNSIIDFLKTKGKGMPFGKNDAFLIADNPVKVLEQRVSDDELRKFLVSSAKLIENSQASNLSSVLNSIKKNKLEIKNENNRIVADLFIAIAERSYELYTSKEWENMMEPYLPNNNNQTKMKPFWKVVTMVAADAAGAAIGALAGANPATTVGAATGVSTLATKLLTEEHQ